MNNFLYSGFEFKEDEDLLGFKFKMINSILVIVALFSTLVGILSDLGISDIGPIHSKVNYVYGIFSVMLIFLLRSSKTYYKKVANALLIASLITFTSALILVPQDEFRIIWFYLLIFVAYILNGSASGLLFTIASLGVILSVHLLSDLQLSQLAINTSVLGLIIGSFLSRFYTNKISDYENSLQQKNAALHVLASTDDLTGIMNRRLFGEVSKRYFETAQRDNLPLSLLLFDLDHFKKVNDTYGHQTGDLLLIRFAEAIKSYLRKSDIVARVGGEEFAVLLFETDMEGAFILAEKIRTLVESITIDHEGEKVFVTTSIGIAQHREGDKAFNAIYARADKALYLAKGRGRNRTCCDPLAGDGTQMPVHRFNVTLSESQE
ncbi:GGDEF domain-containing protein [Sulfurimonas sp. HSL3-7]|uniref:GGDEF domain-containing protein n=1 Tax=Sulfonitrofixus jiaomeiensis TaxID=3131938 RepID=UPI0031F91AAB